MADVPTTVDLLRSAERSALHLELRDAYLPDDPDWQQWQSGVRFDPAERWRSWFDLIREITRRGVEVRRARVVSEPISAYVRFEYDVTEAHNLAAGEEVRWLPRHHTAGLTVPPSDFWVFDERVVIWNHFGGDGSSTGKDYSDDPAIARLCATAFEAVGARGAASGVHT
jgi:hypothetical protein